MMVRHPGMGFSSVLALIMAASANAQEAIGVQEVVVTGTRAVGRTALTSAAPVDVIGSAEIQAAGYPDLASALEATEPSLNFPHAQTTPSSANTRPITLRGLSPDETLVLVDGKRWHGSAVINTNFAVGRGSAPVDLSAIPEAAIDHVEVLKDGAAAQYGSDAIAGVVNIILKTNSSGTLVESQAGVTERGDGAHGQVSFRQGLPLGDGGHLTVMGDLLDQGSTNRSEIDERYGRRTFVIGDPAAFQVDLAATAAYPLPGVRGEIYGDLILARKDSTNTPTFIPPGASPLYPDGSAPRVNPIIYDIGDTLGVKGSLGWGVNYDLSNSFGFTTAAFGVDHSEVAALGAASPTRFDAGTEDYRQDVVDLTFTRGLPEASGGGNIAAGGEFRTEHYGIGRGDVASTTGAGSVGFPGLNPYIPVDASRTNGAAFVDLELAPLRWINLGAAGRYDHYSDFGDAETGKLSGRIQAAPWLAFRGSYSTGFRAPSLQQEDYNSVTVVANGINKALVNVGTFEVSDPVARALGASPLRPETSHDATAGAVLTPAKNLAITADVFRIAINNRIALGNALSGPAVTGILAAAGITNVEQVAFFTNGLNTLTQGFDLSVKYHGELGAKADYVLGLGYESSPTQVRSVATNPAIPGLPLFSAHPILLLTEAQPANKLIGDATLNEGPFSATLGVIRYGHYADAPISAPQTFSGKTIANLSTTYRVSAALALTFGVTNIGNVYPDRFSQISLAYPSYGNALVYGEESPMGTAGRAYYVRLTYSH
jgi:iron complex outermembrane receptor protein